MGNFFNRGVKFVFKVHLAAKKNPSSERTGYSVTSKQVAVKINEAAGYLHSVLFLFCILGPLQQLTEGTFLQHGIIACCWMS